MNVVQKDFIQIFKSSLKDRNCMIPPSKEIYDLASEQEVLPMICETTFRSVDCFEETYKSYKEQAVSSVISQTVRTAQFLDLYSFLQSKGLSPIVVKGIVLRTLYPKPNFRSSVDEDLWIKPEEKMQYHTLLLEYGMELFGQQNVEKENELCYLHKETGMVLEIHTYLFPPESKAYGDLNVYFDYSHTVTVEYEGISLQTLDPTSHVFFLMCHSFKHFVHSGFGIRQISDLILFSNHYAPIIDWETIQRQSQEIHAFDFVKAMYKIGSQLIDSPSYASYISSWNVDSVKEEDLLIDIFESGIHGNSELFRLHSSNITLNAIIDDKKDKKSKNTLLGSVFLPLDNMKIQYAYLDKYPFLLPYAWIQRIFGYIKSTRLNSNEALKSLELGNKRIELLKKYKIIK